jgi:hypothetical protein
MLPQQKRRSHSKDLLSWWLILFLLTPAAWIHAQIPFAHAHNDYEHTRPLLDALEWEFTSVEADIHLIDGELYVYHDRPGRPDPQRTLEKLYLDPLMERFRQNSGSVYPDYEESFLLLVDIKTEAEATYAVLLQKLAPYAAMLRQTSGDEIIQSGAVMVVLSGNRPMATVARETTRLVSIDGRPTDLGKGYSTAYMPLVSDHYRNQLQWNGKGVLPGKQAQQLARLAARIHAEGKKLRLWASPENARIWDFLLDGGADYLNTDLLEDLHQFAKKQSKYGK